MNKKQVTGKTLGELEKEIMEIVWSKKDPISVKDVTEILGKKRKIAYTTTMTIMTRLASKNVLTRHLTGLSYLYKPKVTKEQFVANAVHGIFSTAVSALGDEALSHFIKEIQKISPKKRQELSKMLGKD
ncbi:MAG TPA: BlaI/MecI/CopY family transcriptional regulator [Patescibacteria group bacterium]|nr:BlaI/MecI/CopY family transcriptional regulator [Patescibacteria group bacterium]